jgi:ADP-ribose pyrophosphatase
MKDMKHFPGDDDRKWTVEKSEYLFNRPWLTVRRDSVRLPNGNTCPEYYVLEYPDWINVVAIDRQGKMLLVRQYRHGLQVTRYELCAGVIDPTDATPMDAAKRELLEETGYGNGTWEELCVTGQNPGSANNLTHSFLAVGVEPISTQHLESTEDITFKLFEPSEVLEMLKSGYVVQSLHAAPLWKYFYMRDIK